MTIAAFARAVSGTLLIFSLAAGQQPEGQRPAPRTDESQPEFWQTDLTAARKLAAAAHAPMLVVFRCER
ncbi:MAG: hypothetical protein AB7I19_07705 [Planctomycetota bacterium]